MNIPDEIMAQLVFLSEKEGFAMVQMNGGDMHMLLFARKEFSADQAAIATAAALLNRVIDGSLSAINEATKEMKKNATTPVN